MINAQLFRSARFVISAASLSDLPSAVVPEIAFAGRSNAGKSSAINVLTDQKRLAFASKMPGRTQLLNFFEVSERGEDGHPEVCARLVDLPGYGFAKAPVQHRAQWEALVGGFLAQRRTLVGIVLVMDARRPLQEADEVLISFVEPRHCPLHLLLTKSDQLNKSDQRSALLMAEQRAAQLAMPVTAQLFSTTKRHGVDELASVLAQWVRSSG